jgi:Tol biopolymer transport system component
VAHDFMPVWSHDGKRIAFASDRHGNFDVYVMPASGG